MRTPARGHALPMNGAILSRAPLVISLLALFFALGGTGWAGQVLGHGSVGTAQLARDSVTAPKIAAGAVTKSKLATGAITSGALAPRAIGRDAIAPGAITGDRLAPGLLGGVSATKILTVVSPPAYLPNLGGVNQDVSVSCPVGQRVIGGGWDAGNRYSVVVASKPSLDGAGWIVSFASSDGPVSAEAICVAP